MVLAAEHDNRVARLYERVGEQGLKQNALCVAWFADNAAMMTERFPRHADKEAASRDELYGDGTQQLSYQRTDHV